MYINKENNNIENSFLKKIAEVTSLLNAPW